METICLNPDFSTTRLLIKGGPVSRVQLIAKGPDGGLRKAGYTKAASRSNPIVCIITVTLNGAKFLEQTIKSVLGLAYPNVEFIIIDGGSKDGTVDILRKYNEQIDYWVSEPDEGLYDAMNKAWLLANDQAFILYLGAGDTIISLPDNMSAYKSDQIIYGIVMLSPTKMVLSMADARLRFRDTLHHQALLVNKLIHPEPPFNTRFKIGADFDFKQRLYKEGHEFVESKTFLSSVVPYGVSGTLHFRDIFHFREVFEIVKKNYGIFSALLALVFCFFYIPRALVYPRVKTKKASSNGPF
jgi:glycosyltransferase involved in cell wall biosynthesis